MNAAMVFCHGKLSSPKAKKIGWLRPLAEAKGWQTDAPDFRGLEPEARTALLVATMDQFDGPIALVGSSLGGAIAVFAARQRVVAGLFLMAPAVYYPGYEHLRHAVDVPIVHVFHGWNDEIIENASVIRFAEEHLATLTLVDDNHQLLGRRDALENAFLQFLAHLAEPLPRI